MVKIANCLPITNLVIFLEILFSKVNICMLFWIDWKRLGQCKEHGMGLYQFN